MDVELSSEETERYARQLGLAEFGPRGQERLKQARALVIGVGPLGATAAGQLASVGVGHIGVVDGGKLVAADLPSQTVGLTADIGSGKADSIAARLAALNPEVQLDPYPVELDSDNVDAIVAGHDLVLSCISDTATRLIVNDACVAAGTPLVDSVTRGRSATIQAIRPERDACLRCAGVEAANEGGVAAGLAGAAGSLAALEAIALLAAGDSAPAGRIEIGSSSGALSRTTLEREPACPACGQVASTLEAGL